MIYTKHITTPLGEMIASASNAGVTRLIYPRQLDNEPELLLKTDSSDASAAENLLNQLQLELDEYFSARRKTFTVPLSPQGTEFQKRVWEELLKIPYGKTFTYLQLSKIMKQADAIRAVAGANSRNPIMILIPCHRVNGSNGSLTGYAGGLDAKRFLLELESGRKFPKQMVMDFTTPLISTDSSKNSNPSKFAQ